MLIKHEFKIDWNPEYFLEDVCRLLKVRFARPTIVCP
jgi:hypothetical protein